MWTDVNCVFDVKILVIDLWLWIPSSALFCGICHGWRWLADCIAKHGSCAHCTRCETKYEEEALVIKLWRIICHLAGLWWFAIKADFAGAKKKMGMTDTEKWWNRMGRVRVEAGERGVVTQQGFCFLFNFSPHPMSWVSVTFWTCQANTDEWLELSLNVMCCFPLQTTRYAEEINYEDRSTLGETSTLKAAK